MSTRPPRAAGAHPAVVPRRRAAGQRRALLTAVTSALAGIVCLAVAVAVALSWRGQLPDPVASHWGAGGVADGFTSLDAYVATLAVVALLGTAAGVLTTLWGGRAASTRRVGAALTVWFGAFVGAVLVGSLAPQRGLADAHDAPLWSVPLGVCVLVAFALAALAALAVRPDPPQPATGPVADDAARVALAPGERAAWVGRASGGPMAGIVAGTCVLLVGTGLVTRQWVLLVVAVLLVVLLGAFTAFTVRVDATGLTVRSVAGLPRTHLAADEIDRADVVTVRALRDFGGYGWRLGREGRTGVVLRSGEALEVRSTGGRRFVVTVDDAIDAAALLNTVADAARAA